MTKPYHLYHWRLILALAFSSAFTMGLQAQDNEQARVRARAHLAVAETTILEIKAYWEPVKESMYNLHKQWEELCKLRPAEDTHAYRGGDFQSLLPAAPVAVGDVWEPSKTGLIKFLRQLHPGATLQLHLNNGDSLGAYACLRACDGRFADILLRVHAEFVLKTGWFTPGQFAGRLVVDLSTQEVLFFRLHVPPAKVNFDVGWRRDGTLKVNGREIQAVSTDAGSVPRLELIGGDPEIVARVERILGKSVAEANATLVRRFYRAKDINWVDFDRALALAQKTGKPLHVVAVEGTFDDESC
jgi:hypothetical protein